MSEQRISQIPGRSDKHQITVTQGSEPVMRPSIGAGVDVTVREDYSKKGQAAERVAAMARVTHLPSQIRTDVQVDPALEVCLGENLVLRPSPIYNTPEGWRTKGGVDSHEVYRDGDRLSSSDAVKVIYDALVAMQAEETK